MEEINEPINEPIEALAYLFLEMGFTDGQITKTEIEALAEVFTT